ncbi:helix-hairpin-helix domain-containing protein [Gordonia sp. (in: high G+C Gram-positive bacteria)]|uniref:helix-hairpin-helix domain-containing protein n=1 Tax=unclassified Gordonia (in: high G+C Gram-positive bacteria) TaxID=2657482 RepID=UPI003527042B
MARRTNSPSGGLDRVLPARSAARPPRRSLDDEPPARRAAGSLDPEEWGATAMPSWLDTAAGRRAWAGRRAREDSTGQPDSDAGGDDGFEDDDWAEAEDEASPRRTGFGHWDEVLDPAVDGGDDRRDSYRMGGDRDDDPDDDDPDHDPDDDWARPARRLTMLPPAAIALIGVGVIACVVAGFALFRDSEPATPLVNFPASAGPSSGVPASGGAEPTGDAAEIVVSVAGLVNRPGLVTLPKDARVAQALDRAGGIRERADVLSLNLAQILHDGDQVLVGTREDGPESVRSAVVSSGAGGGSGAGVDAGGGGPGGTAGGKVNLNTATATELDALPGVGPVTAQAIIAWREQHGRFASVEQLGEVDGIGSARLAKLRDAVTVG